MARNLWRPPAEPEVDIEARERLARMEGRQEALVDKVDNVREGLSNLGRRMDGKIDAVRADIATAQAERKAADDEREQRCDHHAGRLDSLEHDRTFLRGIVYVCGLLCTALLAVLAWIWQRAGDSLLQTLTR